ncbi:MAG TPA: hypothetical protein VKR58_09935 [Aquella sp.]|nr:hypothetical protein [Aquella sp.]
MRNIIFGLFSILTVPVFAAQNSLFQEFDNRASIGYGMQQNTSGYGTSSSVPVNSWVYSNSNILNLEAEHLMDIGVWVDVNANTAFGAGQVSKNPITGSNGGTYQSSDYGLNGKVGYAFTMANQHLQIIPYAALGINSMSGVIQYIPSTPGVSANSFAYLGGIGGRLEFRINRTILLFADQLMAYNWDQSGPIGGVMPQNTISLVSTAGAKFNLAQNFQLGVQGVYTNYQPQAGNATAAGFMMQRQWSVGGLVSLGITY